MIPPTETQILVRDQKSFPETPVAHSRQSDRSYAMNTVSWSTPRLRNGHLQVCGVQPISEIPLHHQLKSPPVIRKPAQVGIRYRSTLLNARWRPSQLVPQISNLFPTGKSTMAQVDDGPWIAHKKQPGNLGRESGTHSTATRHMSGRTCNRDRISLMVRMDPGIV